MFSKSAEYSLRAAIFIAQKGSEEKKLSIAQISKGIGSPMHYTGKLLQTLSRNQSIIISVKGPNGGFYMTDELKAKPVIDLLEQVGELYLLNKCVMGLNACNADKPCPLHHDYKEIKKQLLHMYSTKTIGWLASKMNAEKTFLKLKK